MRKFYKYLFFIVLLAVVVPIAYAYAQPITVAFYNTENFADTIANPLTDDKDFTPTGRYRWNTSKYDTKVRNIARVIDEINAHIVGLCEIENEHVLHDLMYASKTSYNYIHRQTRDSRGMDVALLYRGDTFFPKSIEQRGGYGVPREFLVVRGRLLTVPVTIIVCHMPSMGNSAQYRNNAAVALNRLVKRLLDEEPQSAIILMGDFNTSPDSDLAKNTIGISPVPKELSAPKRLNNNTKRPLLFTPFTKLAGQGYGSYVYRDKRHIYDYIAVSANALNSDKIRISDNYGIFVRDYMVHYGTIRQGYPIRTFESGKYTAGYSDHLPVYMTLYIIP